MIIHNATHYSEIGTFVPPRDDVFGPANRESQEVTYFWRHNVGNKNKHNGPSTYHGLLVADLVVRGGYDLKNHEVIVADNRNEVAIWCQEVLNERVYSNEYVEAVKNRWGYSYVLHLSFADEGALIAFKLAWQ